MKPGFKKLSVDTSDNVSEAPSSSSSSLSPVGSTCSSSSLSLLSIGPPPYNFARREEVDVTRPPVLSPPVATVTEYSDSEEHGVVSAASIAPPKKAETKPKRKGRPPKNATAAHNVAERSTAMMAQMNLQGNTSPSSKKKGKAAAGGGTAKKTAPAKPKSSVMDLPPNLELPSFTSNLSELDEYVLKDTPPKLTPSTFKEPTTKAQKSSVQDAPPKLTPEALREALASVPGPSRANYAHPFSTVGFTQSQSDLSREVSPPPEDNDGDDDVLLDCMNDDEQPDYDEASDSKIGSNDSFKDQDDSNDDNVFDLSDTEEQPVVTEDRLACGTLSYWNCKDYPTLKTLMRTRSRDHSESERETIEANLRDNVSADDIDNLQGELETILTTTVLRSRMLKQENEILRDVELLLAEPDEPVDLPQKKKRGTWRKKTNNFSTSGAPATPPSPDPTLSPPAGASRPAATRLFNLPKSKRSQNRNRPSLAGTSTSAFAARSASARARATFPKRPKGRPRKNPPPPPEKEKANTGEKSEDSGSASDSEVPDDERKDIIERFWKSVEPYCPKIRQSDLDAFKKIIDDQANLPPSIFDIPALGKFWKEEEAERPETRKTREARRSKPTTIPDPMTERLVTSFVENAVRSYRQYHADVQAANDGSAEIKAFDLTACEVGDVSSSATNNGTSTTDDAKLRNVMDSLGLEAGTGNTSSEPLQSRIRKSMLENGLLSPDDPLADDPQDEVLAEIRRTQSELRDLHGYNAEILNDLYLVAKREVKRNVIMDKLELINHDLINVYKSGKGKKKSPQGEEEWRKQTYEVLKKRTDLIKQLDAFDEATLQGAAGTLRFIGNPNDRTTEAVSTPGPTPSTSKSATTSAATNRATKSTVNRATTSTANRATTSTANRATTSAAPKPATTSTANRATTSASSSTSVDGIPPSSATASRAPAPATRSEEVEEKNGDNDDDIVFLEEIVPERRAVVRTPTGDNGENDEVVLLDGAVGGLVNNPPPRSFSPTF